MGEDRLGFLEIAVMIFAVLTPLGAVMLIIGLIANIPILIAVSVVIYILVGALFLPSLLKCCFTLVWAFFYLIYDKHCNKK